MEEKNPDVTKATVAGSIAEYQRQHELAKHGVTGTAFDVDLDDDDDDESECIPLEAFSDSNNNQWWVDMITEMTNTKDEFKYDEKTNRVGFYVRLKKEGKYIGKRRYLWSGDMMDAMRTVGVVSFSAAFRTTDRSLWEIEVANSAMVTFGMFLDSLEDEGSELNNAVRGLMSFRSGYFRGAALYEKDIYGIYRLLDKIIRFDDEEFDDVNS